MPKRTRVGAWIVVRTEKPQFHPLPAQKWLGQSWNGPPSPFRKLFRRPFDQSCFLTSEIVYPDIFDGIFAIQHASNRHLLSTAMRASTLESLKENGLLYRVLSSLLMKDIAATCDTYFHHAGWRNQRSQCVTWAKLKESELK